MSEKGMTLFDIEVELRRLLIMREDVLERIAATDNLDGEPELDAELQTVDKLIKDYLRQEVRKVDNIAFAIKNYEAIASALNEAAAEFSAKAAKNTSIALKIKQWALEVLQEFGSTLEQGRLFKMTRQGNGGLKPLVISQPELIPASLKFVTFEVRGDVAEDFALQFSGSFRIVGSPQLDQRRIREALERGEGVPGARLDGRGEHIRIK